METIAKESLKAGLKENFKLYSEDYPTDHLGGPTDESVYSLAVWLGNTFEQEGGAGDTIEEWIEVAIEAFMSYFEFYDKENDERGDTYRYIKSQVVSTLKSHYANLFEQMPEADFDRQGYVVLRETGEAQRFVIAFEDWFEKIPIAYPNFERVDEETECEILTAWFDKSYEHEDRGHEYYTGNGYRFDVSRWEGSWEVATVEAA